MVCLKLKVLLHILHHLTSLVLAKKAIDLDMITLDLTQVVLDYQARPFFMLVLHVQGGSGQGNVTEETIGYAFQYISVMSNMISQQHRVDNSRNPPEAYGHKVVVHTSGQLAESSNKTVTLEQNTSHSFSLGK